MSEFIHFKKEKSFFDYKYGEPEDSSKELQWIVMVEDWNGRKIYPYNVFNHRSFKDGLIDTKKKYNDNFEEFSKDVMDSLRYYFGSKSEWEVVVTSWPPYVESEEIDRLVAEREDHIKKWGNFYRENVNPSIGEKIDVYTQVKMNWNIFIKYLWEHKDLIPNKKRR